MRRLLQEHSFPAGGAPPQETILEEEVITAMSRVTGGNSRLLRHLLAQFVSIGIKWALPLF